MKVIRHNDCEFQYIKIKFEAEKSKSELRVRIFIRTNGLRDRQVKHGCTIPLYTYNYKNKIKALNLWNTRCYFKILAIVTILRL